ncbi:hypothetical protein MELE44368_02395 [Mycolicibacterium elephantis DSM 44368]|uniref:DUF732 domain-containing protein n=1 Tax=Mycolicibacterium elephantis DSM 44368 TaxID=1335622 RepID=A0A439DUW2_9MYCO|nr:hypothetical protein MELE44368_02395 [Mycolicibacterium elephantis DSM 44368]
MAFGGVLSVAPAHAGQDDDEFIELLDLERVPFANKTEVIRAAKDYCLNKTRPNANKWRVAFAIGDDMGWSLAESQDFARAADRAYCT